MLGLGSLGKQASPEDKGQCERARCPGQRLLGSVLEFLSLSLRWPCSFLAAGLTCFPPYTGKFCFDKHIHSFSKSHRGRRLCCTWTNSRQWEVQTLLQPRSSGALCLSGLPGTQLPLCGFHTWNSLPLARLPAGRTREAFLLWALVSWPVESCPVIVPVSCQIK